MDKANCRNEKGNIRDRTCQAEGIETPSGKERYTAKSCVA